MGLPQAGNSAPQFHRTVKQNVTPACVPQRQQKQHSGENNLRLVRLLTTNPAAALPAIFTPSGKYEQRRIRMLPREHRTAPSQTHQPHHGYFQVRHFQEGQFLVGLPLLPEKSYPGLYASEEEIENKGSCCDRQGYFDLEAILPMDCARE